MNSRKYDFLFKCLLIGAQEVGKTSLLKRLGKEDFDEEYQETFDEKYQETIGANFFNYLTQINENKVNLQVWDIAGQERFRSAGSSSHYQNTDVVIVSVDLTKKETLREAEKQLNEIKKVCKNNNPIVILVGTKADLETKIEITKADIDAFIQKNNIQKYMATSAKNETNVKEVFDLATQLVLEKNIINEKTVESQPSADRLSNATIVKPQASTNVSSNETTVKPKSARDKLVKKRKELLGRIKALPPTVCGIDISKEVDFNSWSRNFFKARMKQSFHDYLYDMITIDIKKAENIVAALENKDINETDKLHKLKKELGKHRSLIHFGETTGMEILSKLSAKPK